MTQLDIAIDMGLIMPIIFVSKMEITTLLNSVITAASILVSVGIGFLTIAFTKDQDRKSDLFLRIKLLYPKFRAFRELIYRVYQTDIWKNVDVIKEYNAAILIGPQTKVRELISENEFLKLYKCYKFISDNYCLEIVNNSKPTFSYKELSFYKECANYIWYSYDCRTDIKNEINNDCLRHLNDYKLQTIKQLIDRIDPIYSNNLITIDLIATIAGDIEVTVIDSLCELASQFEKPLDSKVKWMFLVFITTLFGGVAFPLILLLIPSILTIYTTIISVLILIVCLCLIVISIGNYIGVLN